MKFPFLRPALMAAAVTVGAIATTTAQADYEALPRLLVIGTPSTQTASFASTNGWAAVYQEQTGKSARVVPEDSEIQRYRRLVERQDIGLSSVTAAEMRYQLEGIDSYLTAPVAAQRMVWHHNDTPWGFVVSGNSDVETLDDLKAGGVRVAQGAFSPAMTTTVRKALPAFLGMSEDEANKVIRYVPASSYAENCRSVVEGRADVAWCAPISSVLSEMEGAPGGIRWLNMDLDNTEAWQRFLEHSPMSLPATIPFGVKTSVGVDGLTSNFIYATRPDMDADTVYTLAKWFHENHDRYKSTHPLSARMSLEVTRSYARRSPIPLHEGTVRYLKEIGEWTEEDEKLNQEAIQHMDQWVSARKAVMDEAREKRITPSADNDEFVKLHEKHTGHLTGFSSRL